MAPIWSTLKDNNDNNDNIVSYQISKNELTMFNFFYISKCRLRLGLIDSIVVKPPQIVLHESVEGDGEASVEDPDEHNTQVEDAEL